MPAPDRPMPLTPLDAYITQLDTALGPLPLDEKREILRETRSHVVERMQRGGSVRIEDVLAELGPPSSYALGFLPKGQREVEGTTLTNVASLATSGWKSLPVLLLVAAGYGFASLFVFIAIAKIIEPGATGWYVTTVGTLRTTGLVLSDPNNGGRDVLGLWLIPICLVAAGGIHWLLSRLLRRVTRSSTTLQ